MSCPCSRHHTPITCGMMLARLGFITRAYKARVGPLETISMIPIWSFFTRKPPRPTQCNTPSESRRFQQNPLVCKGMFTEGDSAMDTSSKSAPRQVDEKRAIVRSACAKLRADRRRLGDRSVGIPPANSLPPQLERQLRLRAARLAAEPPRGGN